MLFRTFYHFLSLLAVLALVAAGADAAQERNGWNRRQIEYDLAQTKALIGYTKMAPDLQASYRRLLEIPHSGEIDNHYWAGVSWAHWEGGGARRYQSAAADQGDNRRRLQYVLTHSPLAIYRANSADEINRLSPFEKYDILVGDTTGGFGGSEESLSAGTRGEGEGGAIPSPGFGLTKSMWLQIIEERSPKRVDGDLNPHNVDEWVGLCHGWTSAAISVARPTRAIEVLAADGSTKVLFYPEDIKAIASSLYAGSIDLESVVKVGTRCAVPKFSGGDRIYEKMNDVADSVLRGSGGFRPPLYTSRDLTHEYVVGEYGRGDWMDVDPGAFHIALANSVGRNREAFTVDVRSDDEVWNKVVDSFSFSYAKPGKELKSIERGQRFRWISFPEELASLFETVPPESDPAKEAGARSRVLVRADVSYKHKDSRTRRQLDSERNANLVEGGYYLRAAMEDSEKYDMKLEKRYFYELYLDAEGQIVAGAWANELYGGHDHPDFFWKAEALNLMTPEEADARLSPNDWESPEMPFPESFSAVAIANSKTHGRPLKVVVERLVAFSREKEAAERGKAP